MFSSDERKFQLFEHLVSCCIYIIYNEMQKLNLYLQLNIGIDIPAHTFVIV